MRRKNLVAIEAIAVYYWKPGRQNGNPSLLLYRDTCRQTMWSVSSPPAICPRQRDRAILLLLARLGLRAGNIVQMRLQDIDWKGACNMERVPAVSSSASFNNSRSSSEELCES